MDARRRRRSSSIDSEEERRRRRRKKEREAADSGRSRSGRYDEGVRCEDVRDKYDDRDRIRRRSRSPAYESSRRRPDNPDSKHRSKSGRSLDDLSGREGMGSSRENSATQITRKSK